MTRDPAARLQRGLAQLEALHGRELKHRQRISDAGDQMADRATAAATRLRPLVLAGDPQAAALYERALRGRVHGRRATR